MVCYTDIHLNLLYYNLFCVHLDLIPIYYTMPIVSAEKYQQYANAWYWLIMTYMKQLFIGSDNRNLIFNFDI